MNMDEVNDSRFFCEKCYKSFFIYEITQIENNPEAIWTLGKIYCCPFCGSKKVVRYVYPDSD